MTITVKYNTIRQIVMWLKLSPVSLYLMKCVNKQTKEEVFCALENLSPNPDDFALFNITVVKTVEESGDGNNIIVLPLRGEYEYYIYNDFDTIDDTTLAGKGLLINEYSDSTYVAYNTNNNKVVYGD